MADYSADTVQHDYVQGIPDSSRCACGKRQNDGIHTVVFATSVEAQSYPETTTKRYANARWYELGGGQDTRTALEARARLRDQGVESPAVLALTRSRRVS